jgi:hypothetical protein
MERRTTHHRNIALGAAAALMLGAAATENHAAEEHFVRQMGLRHAPEQVFDSPVEQLVPALADAKRTRANGRVGYELAFWGYELPDGREVSLFACALVPNVDCAARVAAICPAGGRVLEQQETKGKVVHRKCQAVATGSSSSVQPGCDDTLNDAGGLLVGLVSCG